MRDANRLNGFYDELKRIHIEYFPDWRFGQFMSNFFGWMFKVHKRDPFFPEEKDMLKLLMEFVNENQK